MGQKIELKVKWAARQVTKNAKVQVLNKEVIIIL